MINWIISSSILIITIILLRSLFRTKISLRLQYALWFLVAVRLLIPINFGTSVISIENLTNQLSLQTQVENTIENNRESTSVLNEYKDYENAVKIYDRVERDVPDSTNINSEESIPKTETSKSLETISISKIVPQILFFTWITGIFVLSMVFTITNMRFRRRLKHTKLKLDVSYSKLPVYISNEVDSPCIFGMFRPCIYVTKSVAEDSMILRHSIYHEMTHFKHGDLLWALIRCMCLAIHWYNPLVWWAAKLSKQDSELACDEATIARLGEAERLAYGKTLIQLTCGKRNDLFVTATTMTSEKKSITERIKLIAKKPKIRVYALILILVIALIAIASTFTNAEKDSTTVPESFETENIDSDPVTVSESEELVKQPELYEEAQKDKVCLAVMPDGISKAGGDYRYIISDDQVTWTDAYKQMCSIASGNGSWYENEQFSGIWIVFNDEWTCITDQGFIYNFSKRVSKEDAASFYLLCIEEAKNNGTGTPVRPEDITKISSATLVYDNAYTVTDDTILTELQKNLSASNELRGGAACPFTASIILKLDSGEEFTLYLATDSCNVWLSDGVYYDYSGYESVEDLYEIFFENGVFVEKNKVLGTENDISNAEKIITQAAERSREGYVDAKLTYVDNSEVGWDYYSDNPWSSGDERDALAQAALKELYTLTGFQVEECVYTTNGASKFIFGKSADNIRKSIAFYSRDYGFTLCGDEIPYIGFVNARRAHYSDVQQLDSPYGKEEWSGHAGIPTWYLEHSGVYQGEKITGYDAINLDDTLYTHMKLSFDGGYYIVVMDEEIESVSEIMGPYSNTPILNLNGNLYYGTDEIGPMGDSGAVGGYIEASVGEHAVPENHGESNFGCVGNPYTAEDESYKIQVLMDDGEYHVFYHEDLWVF